MSLTWIAVIAGVVAAIALFAWLSSSTRRDLAAQLERLAALLCGRCGAPFGAAASEEAHRVYIQKCQAARQQRPEMRINFARHWPVHCSRCGADAQFHPSSGEVGPVTAAADSG